MSDADFFASIRKELFNGSLSQGQVDGINLIRSEWAREGDGDTGKIAYILGTTYHETARTMAPIKEMGSASYLKSKSYWPYIGRGFVQLTWKYNYQHAGDKLGIGAQLVNNPDLALRPDIAVRVLVLGMLEGWFTAKRLADYISPEKRDFVNARRIVNALDQANLIATYADRFYEALQTADAVVPAPSVPITISKPSIWQIIIDFIAALFGRRTNG